jgi:hypothetical protein
VAGLKLLLWEFALQYSSHIFTKLFLHRQESFSGISSGESLEGKSGDDVTEADLEINRAYHVICPQDNFLFLWSNQCLGFPRVLPHSRPFSEIRLIPVNLTAKSCPQRTLSIAFPKNQTSSPHIQMPSVVDGTQSFARKDRQAVQLTLTRDGCQGGYKLQITGLIHKCLMRLSLAR